MTVTAVPTIKEAAGQQTWIDLGLPDLRFLVRELRTAAIEEVKRADDVEGAFQILLDHFGFVDEALVAVTIATPIGDVTVARDKLVHIVEKRPDSRERYVRHARSRFGRFFTTTEVIAWRLSTHTKRRMTCLSWLTCKADTSCGILCMLLPER